MNISRKFHIAYCLLIMVTFSAFTRDDILIRPLEPRTPPTGRYVRYNVFKQVDGIWTCKDYLPADLNICNYEDIFPLSEPFGLDTSGAFTWGCVPFDTTNQHWAVVLFRRGNCTLVPKANPPPGTFIPSDSQVAEAMANVDHLIRQAAGLPTVNFIPVLQQRLSKEEKERLVRKAADVQVAAAKFALENELCPPIVDELYCKYNYAQPSAALALFAAKLQRLALDPADPDYTIISQPITPTLSTQPFTATHGLTQEQADALNELLVNQEQVIGLLDSVITSLDRADGAFNAKDVVWEIRQVRVAQQYLSQAAILVSAQPNLYSNLRTSFETADVQQSVTMTDAVIFHSHVVTVGLSSSITQTLTELGADSPMIDKIRIQMILANPQEIVALGGGQFPQSLTDPTTISALEEATKALEQGVIKFWHDIYLPLIVQQSNDVKTLQVR